MQHSGLSAKPTTGGAPDVKQARIRSPANLDDGAARAMHAELFQTSPKLAPRVTKGPKNVEFVPQPSELSFASSASAQAPVNSLPHAPVDGGIAAFGNVVPSQICPSIAAAEPVGEIPSQELLLAVAEKETQCNGSHHHTVLVFRNDHCEPISVQVDKDATIGSITVAEERLGTLQQPIAVYTCVGSAIKLSERTSHCQQVFLQEFQSGECGVQGAIPSFFQPSRRMHSHSSLVETRSLGCS